MQPCIPSFMQRSVSDSLWMSTLHLICCELSSEWLEVGEQWLLGATSQLLGSCHVHPAQAVSLWSEHHIITLQVAYCAFPLQLHCQSTTYCITLVLPYYKSALESDYKSPDGDFVSLFAQLFLKCAAEVLDWVISSVEHLTRLSWGPGPGSVSNIPEFEAMSWHMIFGWRCTMIFIITHIINHKRVCYRESSVAGVQQRWFTRRQTY